MISRQTIDEIRNRIDIVDVVSDFVSLKRSGQNYKALSPFTNEKTPSFYVVPSKGIFKDFSSGKGGDGISFVMEHEGMSYVEALKYLANKYGVEIKEDARTPEDVAAQSERDSLYIVMNFAKDYYKNLLHQHDEGKSIGLSYFRERGFNDRILEKFELGYSLNEWQHIKDAAVKAGFSENILEKSGLIIKKPALTGTDGDDKVYDRFRGRVIFPVHNLSGKVVAFGARILTKEKGLPAGRQDQPKYINSPETEIYHKSQVLYGLYQAKNEIRKYDFCYLVEGYTDVISLHLSGIDNVVASSGTALTEDQIRLMRRFTENVTVLFDGDAAGIKAALRGIDLVLKGGMNVRVVLLPDGEDPDSYSKKMGSTEFQQYLKSNTKDFISFKIDLLSTDASRDLPAGRQDPIKKAEAIREIVTSISLIPDPIKRSVYIKETSDLLKIQESVLLTELNKIIIQERKKREQERMRDDVPEPLPDFSEEVIQPDKTDSLAMIQMQERELVRLILNYSDSQIEDDVDLVTYFISEFEEMDFINPVYNSIFKSFHDAKLNGELIDSKYLMANGSEEIKRIVAELTVRKHQASKHWKERYHIIFFDESEKVQENAHQNVLRRKYRYIQNLLEENKTKIKEAEKLENISKVDELIMIQDKLKKVDWELASELGVISGKY